MEPRAERAGAARADANTDAHTHADAESHAVSVASSD